MKWPQILVHLVICIMACAVTGCDLDMSPTAVNDTDDLESNHEIQAFGPAWSRLIDEARVEGELVVVFGSRRTRTYRLLLDEFSEKFNIRTVLTPGSSTAVSQRILAERRRERFSVDIAIISPASMGRLNRASALVPLEPLLIHPEVSDRTRGWLPVDSIWQGDSPGYIAATALRVKANVSDIYYNSHKVDPAEINQIRSWQDLLKPMWKGRVVCILDPNSSTAATSEWATIWSVMGSSWFEQFLRDMSPVLLPHGSERELVDGLARGKYDLALFVSRAGSLDIQRLAAAGMPVKKLTRTLAEGNWTSLSGAIGIFDGAPHPKAAQLFTNWYMSREGQTTLQTRILSDDPYPSLRSDVPKGNVADYAWEIARGFTEQSIIRKDPEWDNTTLEESTAFIKSICSELGCYGY